MTEVKWIKLYVDMVSNKKVKRIRKLPSGNDVILIWVFLLAQAGESNKEGGLFLTNAMPFTPEDLSFEFDFPIDVINFALITLEKFEMIEIFEDIIYIKNWNEYQNINGLDKIREQTKERVARHRSKSKLKSSNVTCNVTVTQCNATEREREEEREIDKEEDKEKEREKEIESPVVSKSSDKTIEACKYFESAGFGTINQIVMQKMEDLVTRFSFQWVKDAIDTSVIRGKRKLSYVEGILINWRTEGREENKIGNNGQNRNSSKSAEEELREQGIGL